MRNNKRTRFAKRAMALLLVVFMVCSTAVSAFAVDGNYLMGDTNITSSGDVLISDGGSGNTPGSGTTAASGSLDYLLDEIPSTPVSGGEEFSAVDDSDDFADLENPAEDVPNGDVSAVDASDEVKDSALDSAAETTPVVDAVETSSATTHRSPYWWLDAAIEAGWVQWVENPDELNTVKYSIATIAADDDDGDDEDGSTGSGTATASPGYSWSGGNVTFASDPVGFSGVKRLTVNGQTAFCGNYGTSYPDGSELLIPGDGDGDARIKQILANYDKSSKSADVYAAAQILIWEVFEGPVTSWGGSNLEAIANALMATNAPTDNVYYDYMFWHGADQDPLITYRITTTPPTTPNIPPPTDSDETSQNAYGLITIVKVDDDNNPLSGARFNIDITFSDGSTGGVQGFEVSFGQRTYWYNHPPGDIKPATVVVTEVEAPEGYVLDPTPQTFTVMPTYAVSGGGGGGEEADDDDDDDDDDWDFGDDDDDDDEGEGGGGGGGATVVMGDHPVATFVNKDMEVSLIIVKYEKGSTKRLPGARFRFQDRPGPPGSGV